MNTTDLIEKALLHNGMKVGKSAPQTVMESVLSSRQKSIPSKRKNKRKLLICSLAMIMICLFVGSYASISQAWIYQKMDSLMLIPKKEPFTALYFEYYDDLPAQYAPGDTVSFTFTIKNAEGLDKEYAYDVYIINAASRKMIPKDKGTTLVKNEESQTITKSYIFAEDYGQEAIFVELPESKQAIHFILKGAEK